MEANRSAQSPVKLPNMRIDKDTFDFVKRLSVGDKGAIRFVGNIIEHVSGDEEKHEFKRIKFSNLESTNDNARIK